MLSPFNIFKLKFPYVLIHLTNSPDRVESRISMDLSSGLECLHSLPLYALHSQLTCYVSFSTLCYVYTIYGSSSHELDDTQCSCAAHFSGLTSRCISPVKDMSRVQHEGNGGFEPPNLRFENRCWVSA